MNTPEKRGSFLGLLPLIIFISLYIAATAITGDASTMPLNVGITIAIIFSMLFAFTKKGPKRTFDDLFSMFCKGGGNGTLILMVFIFLVAGMFYLVTDKMGAAKSASNLGLSLLPSGMVLPGLFLIACALSFSLGTSMGTVTTLMPIAIEISVTGHVNPALTAGIVVGGAMFGDNLSLVSDTTIAATRSQDVAMRPKLRVNALMVLPALIINTALLAFVPVAQGVDKNNLPWDFWQLIPLLLVIVLALLGIHVILAIGAAVLAGLAIGLIQGTFTPVTMLSTLGDGIKAMEDVSIIAIMVGGLVALMTYQGGLDWLLHRLTRRAKTARGGEFSIAGLATLLDLSTTNNTIAIITAGPLAKEITDRLGGSRTRTASILDLFTCAGNGICPWAGQILVAAGLAKISTLSIVPFVWYPWLMFACGILFILFRWPRGGDERRDISSEPLATDDTGATTSA